MADQSIEFGESIDYLTKSINYSSRFWSRGRVVAEGKCSVQQTQVFLSPDPAAVVEAAKIQAIAHMAEAMAKECGWLNT